MPWLAQPYNSWGLRDAERQIKPTNVQRTVFIGDSFVESWFTPKSLTERVGEFTSNRSELVNLGISGSGPLEYFFRTRDVALPIGANTVVLCLFAGNDFETVGFLENRTWGLGPAEGASLPGLIAPHLRWELHSAGRKLDRLLSGRGPRDDANELLQMARGGGGVAAIARYTQANDTPWVPVETVQEVLDRGEGRMWRGLAQNGADPEVLYGWMLASLVGWETGKFPTARSAAEARTLTDDSVIENTFSWIAAILDLGRRSGVAVRIVVIPPPNSDPDYVDFWRPWPRQYSWNYIGEDRERRLVERLQKSGTPVLSLRNVLEGVRGSYRKLDGHWTEKGQALAAQAIAEHLR